MNKYERYLKGVYRALRVLRVWHGIGIRGGLDFFPHLKSTRQACHGICCRNPRRALGEKTAQELDDSWKEDYSQGS